MSEVFSERLKRLLAAKGKSQRNLALTVGLSVSAVNKYAQGEREPGMYHLSAIADYLDTSMDFLAGRTDEFPAWYEDEAKMAFKSVEWMIDKKGFREWVRSEADRCR